MGKFKKDKNKLRSKKIQIRLTENDFFRIKSKADLANISVSDLVRKSALATKTWTVRDKKIAGKKIREIARIGNNLNQIARWANTYKDDAEASEVIKYLIAIERELKCI